MIISGSFWRKTFVTVIAAAVFVWLAQATILDSRYAARQALVHETTALPTPGSRLSYTATAYCKGLITTSGVAVQSGIAAADPELLPVGSVVDVDSLPARYNGIYTVLDTGSFVQGRVLDLFVWNCNDAQEFGRRPVHLTVLRLGWNPKATTPSFLDRFFKRPSSPELPARPLPIAPQEN